MATFTLAARNAALDAENARKLAEFARETGEMLPDKAVAGATLPGDRKKLRGIPTTGVGGRIEGTNPLAALMAKQPRED